jgi:hypothetical protein
MHEMSEMQERSCVKKDPRMGIGKRTLGWGSATIESGGSSATASGSIDLIGFGPGIAYYLATNTYLSATLLFTKVQVSDSKGNNTENASDMGFGGSGTIGQEWWVSTDWGIGVAGQFTFASMKAPGDGRWTSYAASLLFTATYN